MCGKVFFYACYTRADKEEKMITLMAIIMVIVFLKIVAFIFGAGLRILGWLLSGLGFLISIVLAVSVIGFAFYLLPVLLVIGVVMIAMKTAA